MTLDVLSFRLTRMAGRLVSIATCALTGRRILGAALGLGVAFGAQAADVLIIDYGIVATIDTNLQSRLQAAGANATIISSNALPTDLSMYSQVWDLGANATISTGYASTITSYLQGGGTMFLMGENAGYGAARNTSLVSLIADLGGGTIPSVTTNSSNSQTVDPALFTANSTSAVSFAAIGKFDGVGTGMCITSGCGAAAWGAGTLSNALRGSFVSVLDVNFLGGNYFQPDFTDNLIGYLVQQGQIGNGGATDIGTGAAAYDASNLGTTLNPVFHGGTLNIDAANMTLAQNFAIGVEGGTIQAVANQVTLTGTIADDAAGTPGALTVAGGRVTLEGVNTYTGATSVTAGTTLALSGAGSIATSAVVVADGTLDVSGANTPAAVQSLGGSGRVELGGNSLVVQHGASSFAGVVAGSGGIAVTGGTQTFTGANTYTGATQVANGGTLVLSGASTVAASSSVTVDGTLDVSGTSGAAVQGLHGAGAVQLGAQTLTLQGTQSAFAGNVAGTGGVTLSSGAAAALSGTNAYTGATNIGSGATLALSGTGSIASSSGVINAGTLDISGSTSGVTLAGLDGNGQVVLGASTLTLAQGHGAFGGAISGSGNVVLAGGSLVYGTNQAYTGTTTVQGGVLSVNAVLAGSVNVASGAELHGSGRIAGPITVAAGGRLAPGNSPGVMTTGSTVTLAAGATFDVDVNGATAGNGAGFHDQLNVTGATSQFVANGATLDVHLTDIAGLGAYTAYVPKVGDTYRIVTAEGGLGSTRFAALDQPDGLAAGTRLRVVYNTGAGLQTIDLKVVPTSLAAHGASAGYNRNALAVATSIDHMLAADDSGTATAAQSEMGNAVLALDGAALDATLVALSGEIHGALAAAQPLSGQQLQGAVSKHLAMSTTEGEARLTGWADYSTGETRWSADAISSGARATHNALTVGVDVWQSGVSRVGVAAASTSTQVGSSAGSSGKLEDTLAVVYGQHGIAGVIGDAQLGYGTGHSRSNRADPLDAQAERLTTNLSTRQQFASVGVRKAFDVAGTALEPFARFGVQQVQRDAGSEGGASPSALSVGELSASGNRLTAGLSVTGSEKNPMVSACTFRGTVAVGRDGGDLLNPVVATTLNGMAGSVQAPDVGRGFVAANVFATRQIVPGAYAFAGLSGEARSNRVQKAVSVGAAIEF